MHQRLAGGSVAGHWILSAGLGATGGAQPRAAKLAGASILVVECRLNRIETLLGRGALDQHCTDLEDALDRIRRSQVTGQSVSIALQGNAAELYPKLVARGERPEMVTDRTPADRPLAGYLPAGWDESQRRQALQIGPETLKAASAASLARQVEAMLVFRNLGVPVFELGNGIRRAAADAGVAGAMVLAGVELDWRERYRAPL